MKLELGDIISIAKGKKHSSVFSSNGFGRNRYIQIEDLRNRDKLKYTDENGVEVKDNDIIIAWDGANAGTIGFGLNGFIGSTLARLRIEKKGFCTSYLGWYLKSKSDYLRSKCTGATIPHINRITLEGLKIPKVDLKTQQEIAHVLEQADKARQQRKAANALTDEFLQSSFLSLFGDPLKNERGWEVKKLIDCVTMRGGGTPDTKNEEYFSGDIPWVSPKDMKSRFIVTSIDKITEKAIKESSTKLIERENVLMVVRSGILKNTLPIGINMVPVAINQDMKAFACKPFLNPYFLAFQFEITASHILQSVRGTTADNISSDVLKNINLIIPPLSLQQQFAAIVAEAEALRKKQQESEQELEQLFQSLLQKYFG